MYGAHILALFVIFLVLYPALNRIESRFLRVALKSFLFAACTALTVTPPALSHGGITYWLPYPLVSTLLVHIFELPDSLGKYLLNWYIYPLFFWWSICFAWGYIMSAATFKKPEDLKPGEGQWF